MDTILLFMLPAGLWAQDAGVAATTAAPDATAGALGELATGLNTVWMLLAAMLVFFMQPGFALVEAGFIRTKNTANVLMKNLVDFMFGSILFWFIGFGLMFGIGGFVGAPHFFNLEAMDKIIDNGLPIEGFLIFPDCILRYGGHHRVRSHGGTYQVLHVSGLYCLYQRTHLSGFRPLDLGRRMADERRRRLLYDEDVRHYFP